MTAKIDSKRNMLVVEIPLQNPSPSKTTGKTMIIASSGGFKPTTAQYDGKAVSVSVCAFFKP